jgi:hypothetical protein
MLVPSRQNRGRRDNNGAARLARVEAETKEAQVRLPGEVAAELEPVEVPASEVGGAVQLQNLWNKVKELERGWEKAQKKAKEQAESDEKALNEAREELEADRAAHAKESERLDAMSERLDAREAEIAREELAIEEQRSAAKAGFAADLRSMTQEAAARRDEILADTTRLEDDARVRAAAIVAAAQAELEAERARLAEESARLREREVSLREQEAQADSDRQLAQAKEMMLVSRLERQMEAQTADIRAQRDDARELLDLEHTRRESRERDLRDLRDRLERYDEDPESAKRRIEDLLQQVANLSDELSRRPPADEVAELRQKAKEAATAVTDADYWRQQHDQIDRQYRYQMQNVGELEVLRDERDALAAQRETLRQAIAQQKTEWEEIQEKENSKEPFPACSAYDRDKDLNRSVGTRPFGLLTDLVGEVRDRMATGSRTSFYYSQQDVRLFLAGLASSRLHLLQGISCTGKTSLPREFFKALGGAGAVQLVEVQAGWRDKDDLFGYYNAFEKRFAESEFTKALYRALLPANIDRPMVIVLDEMNLAHPEQYFGTMLSVLENTETEDGQLALLTSAVPGLPRHFNGSKLPLPPNVWFVGTANHDETTVAFADKTYDRAHVQELSSRHESFNAVARDPEDQPVSFTALQQAFNAATRRHDREVAIVKQFLDEHLHDQFEQFKIGWGNRLDRQVERFVPVVLASGGSLTEAVDHLVATKLARKLVDRFGVRADHLVDLAVNIEAAWNLDGGKPVKTLKKIHDEADRLSGGYGA